MARILVVDDNTENRYLLEVLLKGSGYEVSVAGNGAEALDSALKDPPDLVISDLLMPVMDGFSLCHAWKSNDRLTEIPFIVYTATYTEQKDEDLALSLGADRFVVKPQEPEVLIQVIRDVFSESRSENKAGDTPTEESVFFKKHSEIVFHKLEQKMAQLEEKNQELERTLADRKRAAEHIEHLNRVLSTIRDVNQLIVREKSRPHLIQRACEILVQKRGFNTAWIVLTDRLPENLESGRAGIPESAFSELIALLRAGKLSPCCSGLKTRSTVVHIESIAETCKDCPLTGIYNRASALIANLAHEGQHYGYLGMSTEGSLEIDEQELSLVKEMAGDLGFGLHAIETEEAQRESEQSLRTIFDSATDGILLADAQTRRFVNANRAVCRMLGYTLEELKDLSVDDIHPVEGLEHVVSEFEKQLKGEKILARDIPMQRKDGSVFFADVNSARIELQGRKHLLGIFRDITERKQAEQELHETIEELQQTQLQLTQRTSWMQALNSISGEIARRNSLESIMRVVIQYLEDSFPFIFAGISLRRKEHEGSYIGVLSSRGRSLASRLGIEEGERISAGHTILPLNFEVRQARLVKLADIDPADMPQESRLLVQNLKKEGMKEIVMVPLDVEKIRVGAIFMLFKKHVELGENEWGFLNGMAEYVSLSAQSWRLYAELEESYRRLQEAQEAMMRQERLSAMGQMASGIAHDINNVLVPISLYTEALLEGEPGLSDRANRFLITIQKGVRDIENVTLRLRSFYKKEEEGEFQFLSIEELFDSVIELSRPRWKDIPNQKGIVIQMQKELEKGLPVIIGSESEVREALINLVFNAVDAMPKGGTITLKGRKQDSCVVAEITDTGIGMDQEQKRRCLEPFFTTKGERGSGLGLSSVFGMMQRHNGEMEIESEPGKGTTIRLLFPLGDRKSRETTAIEESVPLPCLRILCVDDDQRVREALKEMLALEGHNVTVCASGEKAVKLFRTGCAEERGFDLVITDLGMPHMDGKAVAQEIKKASNATPVILLSGWGNFMNLNGELPENVDCLLGKPPRMNTLRGAISALMSRREK